MSTIEQSLIDDLARKFGGQPKLEDSLSLVGVDSVGMAELTCDIEKEFGICVDDGLLSVETVQELAEYIRARQLSL